MTQKFYTLEEMASRFGVGADVFIQAWIDKRLPLYIYFQNLPCTIRRCVSAEMHECGKMDIQFGRDYYQSKDSPVHDVMMFVPEDPLSAHFKVRHRFEMGGGDGPRLGEYYEYRYRGYANGYWLAQPTRVTHLSREKYLLTDKESVDCMQSSPGDVTVHAFDMFDYLIFSESIYIGKTSLMIREDEIKINLPELEQTNIYVNNVEGTPRDSEVVTLLKEFPTPKIQFALYLMIHASSPNRRDKTPIVTKITSEFTRLWDEGFTESTVNRWAKKPNLKSNKRLRPSFAQKTGIFILLSTYCARFDIKKNASAIATLLTELAVSTSFNLDVEFSADDVRPWLKRPSKKSE
uniref:Uncharacterized protein n=1 Tax=Serratia marcescens TaxID=615 RepID=A0A9X8VM02_SERMA